MRDALVDDAKLGALARHVDLSAHACRHAGTCASSERFANASLYVCTYVCVCAYVCVPVVLLAHVCVSLCVCVCVYGCYTCMRLDADFQMNAVCIFFSCMQRNGSVCPRVHMDTHTPLSCTHASRAHSRVHVQLLTAQDTFVKTLFRALVTALVFIG
jgi:hypothetical protein